MFNSAWLVGTAEVDDLVAVTATTVTVFRNNAWKFRPYISLCHLLPKAISSPLQSHGEAADGS